MPCRNYDDEPTTIKKSSFDHHMNKQAEKLDQLTALLCKASQMLLKAQPTNAEASNIFEWYEAHRDSDINNMINMLEMASDLNPDFFNEKVSIEDFDKLDALLSKILEAV
jgi:translation initiation factor 2B subunit (eIF-2B alpha/beta/delta family)